MSSDERVDPLLSQTHKRIQSGYRIAIINYVLLCGSMNVDLDSPSECLRRYVLEAGEFLRVSRSGNHTDQLHRAHSIVVLTGGVNALGSWAVGYWWITILFW